MVHFRQWMAWVGALMVSGVVCGDEEGLKIYVRSLLDESRGRKEEAEERLREAYRKDPASLYLLRRLVGLHVGRGEIAEGSALWRKVAEEFPERWEVQLGYVDFLRSATPDDDFAAKRAGEILEKWRERGVEDPGVDERLFRIYEQRELRGKSMVLFREVGQKKGVGWARLSAAMGRVLHERGDPVWVDEQVRRYRGAMEEAPGSAVLVREVSDFLRENGRVEEAVILLDSFTKEQPTALELRVRLGLMEFTLGREKEGERRMLEILEIDALNLDAHQALAVWYRQQGELESGVKHGAVVLRERGGAADEYRMMADELLATGQAREARLLLEKGVYRYPEDEGLMAKWAVATWEDEESRGEAVRRFREAEAMMEGKESLLTPEFLVRAAEVMWAEGQKGGAEERLRQAIRRFPAERRKETAAALRKLAGWWRESGKNEAAGKALILRAEKLEQEDR